jgi:hypothetical protein
MGSVAATGAHLRGRRRGGREGLHHAMGAGSSAPRARTARHHCRRSSAVTCVLCQDRRPGSQPPPRFAAAAAHVHSRRPCSLSPPPCFLCAPVHSRRPGLGVVVGPRRRALSATGATGYSGEGEFFWPTRPLVFGRHGCGLEVDLESELRTGPRCHGSVLGTRTRMDPPNISSYAVPKTSHGGDLPTIVAVG